MSHRVLAARLAACARAPAAPGGRGRKRELDGSSPATCHLIKANIVRRGGQWLGCTANSHKTASGLGTWRRLGAVEVSAPLRRLPPAGFENAARFQHAPRLGGGVCAARLGKQIRSTNQQETAVAGAVERWTTRLRRLRVVQAAVGNRTAQPE